MNLTLLATTINTKKLLTIPHTLAIIQLNTDLKKGNISSSQKHTNKQQEATTTQAHITLEE